MRLRRLHLLLIMPVLLIVALLGQPPANVTGATVPANFTDTLLFNVPGPTAIAFTPDGRLLINTQAGALRVYQNGALLPTPAMTIPTAKICTDSERGLLGVTVDPDFTTNHYIYVYYTFAKFNTCDHNTANSPVNRVSRFVLGDNNLVEVDWTQQPPASGETVLLDNIPSPNGNHNGGDLHFGQDNLLYISVGDGGCSLSDSPCQGGGGNGNARRLDILSGKILRLNKDGSVPTSNPRYNEAGSRRCGNPAGVPGGAGPCQEMFAWGLRNPFRFAFQPGTNQFYINDVGQNVWEEIDQAQANADYGWNVREGFCPNGVSTNCSAAPAGMTDPIFAYQHDGCNSITGGVFAPPGVWPPPYDGKYFFSDYSCGKIFILNGSPGSYTKQDFVTGMGGGSAVSLIFGPYADTQALYYTSYAGGGAVHVLAYSNRTPTAAMTAQPTTGTAPLNVNFDGSGSTDPDGNGTIDKYFWNFGDSSPTVTTTTALTSHTYTAAGNFTATLKVQDTIGAQSLNTASVQVFPANTPPAPVIDTPSPATEFTVGDPITLTGHATDQQDGILAQAALSWTVILHHNSHTHPFLGPTPGSAGVVVFNGPAPENLAAAADSYLEIQLKATDSNGASTVITQALQPKKVNITFATNPTGGKLSINSTLVTTTQPIISWQNYVLNVTASQQTIGVQDMAFDYWPDLTVGDPDRTSAFRSINTPASASNYTATFKVLSSPCVPTAVTIYDQDDINLCGTLRYAVANAPADSAIDLSGATTISLTNTLNISRGLWLQGKANCTTAGSGVTIQAIAGATGPNIDGLVLSGGVRLTGVTVKQFGGRQLVTTGGTGNNLIECSVVSKI